MSDLFASVNGVRATSARVVVPPRGPWLADLVLEDESEVTGRVTVSIGELQLVGTVSPLSGTFGLQRSTRIVAGGGGWGRELPPQSYHNDAGVKALNVAQDAARLAGESLGEFTPSAARVGVDFVRSEGKASTALERAAGTASWWVDYSGTTIVGTRPSITPSADSYEVLSYDPRTQKAVVAVDDPRAVMVGTVLTERLDSPITVRELEIHVSTEGFRVHCWCGAEDSRGQVAEVFGQLLDLHAAKKLFGLWRYRVVTMAGDRVHLQVIRKATGLPDVLHVPMRPGTAGAHAELAGGSEVLVQFVEGDRTLPIITHFMGRDGAGAGAGFVPDSLNLCNGEAEAARNGDSVEMLLPPLIFSGTVGGAPATGVLTATTGKLIGSIVSGSGKVKIG